MQIVNGGGGHFDTGMAFGHGAGNLIDPGNKLAAEETVFPVNIFITQKMDLLDHRFVDGFFRPNYISHKCLSLCA